MRLPARSPMTSSDAETDSKLITIIIIVIVYFLATRRATVTEDGTKLVRKLLRGCRMSERVNMRASLEPSCLARPRCIMRHVCPVTDGHDVHARHLEALDRRQSAGSETLYHHSHGGDTFLYRLLAESEACRLSGNVCAPLYVLESLLALLK